MNAMDSGHVPVRYYRHFQGAYITVFEDGTLDARKPDGKKKKTSATAENLLAGHGAWQEVKSLDDADRPVGWPVVGK